MGILGRPGLLSNIPEPLHLLRIFRALTPSDLFPPTQPRAEALLLSRLCLALAGGSNFGFRSSGVNPGGRFQRELAGGPRHFPSQSMELFGQLAVLGHALLVKRFPGLRNWHHQGYRPAAKRADNELHGVYSLQALHPARGADQSHHFVGEVRRIAVSQQLQPVQRVLEGAADGSVIHGTAPDEPGRPVDGVAEFQDRFWRLVVLRLEHGKRELADVEIRWLLLLPPLPARRFSRRRGYWKAAPVSPPSQPRLSGFFQASCSSLARGMPCPHELGTPMP